MKLKAIGECMEIIERLLSEEIFEIFDKDAGMAKW